MATTINMAEQQNMRNIAPAQDGIEEFFQQDRAFYSQAATDALVSNAINESLIYHIGVNNFDTRQINNKVKNVSNKIETSSSSSSTATSSPSIIISSDHDDSIANDCVNTAVCGCCEIVGFAAAAGIAEYYYPAAFGEYYYKDQSAASLSSFSSSSSSKLQQTQLQRGEFRRGGEPKPKPHAAEAQSIIRGGCGGDRRNNLQQLRLRINQLEAEKESLVIQVSDLRQLMQRISDQGQQDLKAVMKLNRKLNSEVMHLKEDLQGVQKNSKHFNEMFDLWSNHVF